MSVALVALRERQEAVEASLLAAVGGLQARQVELQRTVEAMQGDAQQHACAVLQLQRQSAADQQRLHSLEAEMGDLKAVLKMLLERGQQAKKEQVDTELAEEREEDMDAEETMRQVQAAAATPQLQVWVWRAGTASS